MATVVIPDEVMAIVEAEVLEAYVLESIDCGDEIEMTAQSWRDLRVELHRQAGIDS